MPTTKQEECFNVPKYSQDLEYGGERNSGSHVHDENKRKVSTNTTITKLDNTSCDILKDKHKVAGIPQAASETTISTKKAALKQDVLDAAGINKNNGNSELSKEAKTKLVAENDKESLVCRASIPEYALNNYSDDLEYDDDDGNSDCNDGYESGEKNKRQSAANRPIKPTEEHRKAAVRTSGPQYAIDIEAMDDDDDDLLNAKYQQFERPASSGNRMTNMEQDTPQLAADSKSNNVSTLPGAVSVGSSRKEVRYSSKLAAWKRVHCNDYDEELHNILAADEREENNKRQCTANKTEKNTEKTKVAILVDEQVESEALNRRVEEVIRTTTIVTAEEEIDDNDERKRTMLYIASIVVMFVVAIVVLAVILTRKATNSTSNIEDFQPQPTPSPTSTLKPTLETVLERGVLKCGVPPHLPGFSILNKSTGEYEGFEIDSCRSVAAAVMGANYSIEVIELSWAERFLALANKTIDLLTQGTTHTMERDVYQGDSQTGFSFSTPYLYNGLGFGGKPPFVRCADNLQAYGNCSELKICVLEGTTHYTILEKLFPDWSLYTLPSDVGMVERLIRGDCNVIAHETTIRSRPYVRSQGYTGEYSVGKTILSKEPLAIVTRDDDHEWSQIVNWVLQAQFLAEAMNITQDNADEFSNISPFGEKYNNMFINAISAVGNYGERYERYWEKILPRQGLNMLYLEDNQLNGDHNNNNNNNNYGLIYSYPFGPIGNDGPGPTVGSRLRTILERGMLRCGITEIRDGFAMFDTEIQEWSGLDIDYCKAIAAAMFGGMGDSSTVEYVNLTTIENVFDSLVNYNVDVVCGVNIDIEANIEMGISFSQSYFYEGKFKSRSLATYGKEDSQFSDFVWWLVSSTFYAEEKNITSTSIFNAMPEVRVFGPQHYEMFRDVILVTGNYGDMYERNLQSIIPRSGRNNLNNLLSGPQINPYAGF